MSPPNSRIRTKLLFFFLFAVASLACSKGVPPEGAADGERNFLGLLQTAEALVAAGETIRAEQYFSAALELGAPAERVVPRLIVVCAKAGRLRSATSYAQSYLEQHPRDGELRFLLATLYFSLGEIQKAEQELSSILRLEPSHIPALKLRAFVALETNSGLAADHVAAYLAEEPAGSDAEWLRESLAGRFAYQRLKELRPAPVLEVVP